jgi:hypothetical protein
MVRYLSLIPRQQFIILSVNFLIARAQCIRKFYRRYPYSCFTSCYGHLDFLEKIFYFMVGYCCFEIPYDLNSNYCSDLLILLLLNSNLLVTLSCHFLLIYHFMAMLMHWERQWECLPFMAFSGFFFFVNERRSYSSFKIVVWQILKKT